MSAITVLGPGCEVMIHGEVAGRIATVNIRQGGVCYEVVWMDGATRHREWVEEFEVEARHEREEVRVGFTLAPPAGKVEPCSCALSGLAREGGAEPGTCCLPRSPRSDRLERPAGFHRECPCS